VRRQVAGWLAGAGTVVAVGVSVAATRHADPTMFSPVVPDGAWRQAWLVCPVAALAGSGLGVVLARSGMLRLRAALVVALVIQLLPLAAPVLLSEDVYLYWAEARVVTVHHANPYVVPPSRYPDDPATRAASADWRLRPEAYGPAWAAVGTLPALAAGRSAHTAELLYRVVATLGILLLLAVVAWRTRSAAAIALLGWSPLVALHYAGGAHNDALMTLLLVVGVVYGTRAAGGVAWPLASMVKAVPLVLLPLDLARDRFRRPFRFWVGLLVATVLLFEAAFDAFRTHWISTALNATHRASGMGGVHFLMDAGLGRHDAVLIARLVFLAVYLALLWEAWHRRRSHLGLAAAALCMCSNLLRPWYGLWPLALAATEGDGISEMAAFALSAYLLIGDALPL
jgi:hypothetical protein